MLPFVGVDGEGGNVGDDHRYMMLRVGDRYHVTDGTEDPAQWLRFIATQPKKHIYVAFFFDYDVTMMLRRMPEPELRHLIQTGEVQWGEFRIGYRPRKELWVRWRGNYRVVNDVGSFFQCSFVAALDKWGIGTEAERDSIKAGKEERNAFGHLQRSTIEYNALECQLLAQLMDKFRRACIAIGYTPQRWQGPGQLAKAMLRAHGIPMTQDLPEPNMAGIWEAAQSCYYGGRFEISAVGPVSGPVDGWDIGSAYPYACTLLPCLQHVTWRPSRTVTDHGMYFVTYTHKKQSMWYTLPHRRSNGSICYPRSGAGWYWGVELLAAMQAGASLTVHHGFEWEPHCDHRQFEFMHRLYSVRKALGKSEAGMAIKLAMNSVYGVTAQSVGRAPYANPIYAGLITAHTRAKLLDAIRHDPSSVYMLATDGLYCRADSLPLTSSAELGGWELTRYPDGMFIVQPGLYFAGQRHTRTRGVPGDAVKKYGEELRSSWTGSINDGYDFHLRQFLGLRIAIHRGRLDLAGQWLSVTKRIGYDWSTKRSPSSHYQDDAGVRVVPYENVNERVSTPYSKIIGNLAEEDKLEWMDVPDWGDRIGELI